MRCCGTTSTEQTSATRWRKNTTPIVQSRHTKNNNIFRLIYFITAQTLFLIYVSEPNFLDSLSRPLPLPLANRAHANTWRNAVCFCTTIGICIYMVFMLASATLFQMLAQYHFIIRTNNIALRYLVLRISGFLQRQMCQQRTERYVDGFTSVHHHHRQRQRRRRKKRGNIVHTTSIT